MENENLLKKIASSFASTTNVSFDDLFQEASLAYFEALRTYDPSKAVLSTHVWHCVSNRLKNYVKEDKLQRCEIDGNIKAEECDILIHNYSFFESLGKEAREIAMIILESPLDFDLPYLDHVTRKNRYYRRRVQKKIKNVLYEKGWLQENIYDGFRQFKVAFS
jgi:DNA-directed RNA polymerase specialized sigma subunit